MKELERVKKDTISADVTTSMRIATFEMLVVAITNTLLSARSNSNQIGFKLDERNLNGFELF